jgi:3-oxoacyl-[acyl-carrier-protein] synthase II
VNDTKVVVTGIGATTPLAGDAVGTWAAMLRGESGIRLVDNDNELWRGLPPIVAGSARVEPGLDLPPARRRRLGRCARFAVTAAAQAWTDAGLDDAPVDPRRVAVSVSTAMGDMDVIVDGWEVLKQKGWHRIPPRSVPMFMGNGPAAAVGLLVNAHGGTYATVNACASGTQALATAVNAIRSGVVDIVVAGGAEAPIHPLTLGGFAAMRALSQRVDDPESASRPYDADRDGMVLSEGAGILVLESERHAVERGARIYAELAGIGISSDAYDMVQPEPNGIGQAQAIRAALADAGVAPDDVAFINANGTATVPGDAAEARAVQAVFGDDGPALTASKSMIGHTIGAAGGIESIATVLAVYHGVVPPTRNFGRLDDGVAIDVVHGEPRKLTDGQIVAVKCSAGFGGHNVALTFRGVSVHA